MWTKDSEHVILKTGSAFDSLQDRRAEDFRKVVVVLALLLSTYAGGLIRDRVPMRWSQLRAMHCVDYVILLNCVITWLFNFLCGIMAGLNFDGIECSFAAYFCLLVIGISKLTVLLLMTETLHYIHSQIHQVSRRQDTSYLVHVGFAMVGIVTCLIWVFIDFRGQTTNDICHIVWHRISFLYSLVFLLVMNTYLTFRCSFMLLRTKHAVLRAWAYRYIAGFIICSVACLLNLGFMALCRGQMAIFVCLTACLLDGNVTVSAIHFLLHPNPAYVEMDDCSSIEAENLSPEMEEVAKARCPSIWSKGAPTYRTRQTTYSAGGIRGTSMHSLDTKNRMSCTLVSGATPQGIAAYLSQIDQESGAPLQASRESAVLPRHISLLPSHPAYAQRKWPKPMYSHYPNYSIEDVSLVEEEEVDAHSIDAESFEQSDHPSLERTPMQRADSSMVARARALLYACDDLVDDQTQGLALKDGSGPRNPSVSTADTEETIGCSSTITFGK